MQQSSSETPQLWDKETRKVAPATKPGTGHLVLCIAVLLLLAGALGFGFWRHYSISAQGVATAERARDSVPSVRTAAVQASGAIMSVTWPGTTEAFAQANIYARASGYISKRNVDIGSQVKAGDLLVEITAPELDHQIAQAEGTLAQLKAALQDAKAQRDLAQVNWDRDNPLVQKGWVTSQQGKPLSMRRSRCCAC
jgi:multidrug efflux pump subunit AcrA (membrane-fusion protein)